MPGEDAEVGLPAATSDHPATPSGSGNDKNIIKSKLADVSDLQDYYDALDELEKQNGKLQTFNTGPESDTRDRWPTLFEILNKKTQSPLDLWSFYVFMRDEAHSIDYIDFWIDTVQHINLCKVYVKGLKDSLLVNTKARQPDIVSNALNVNNKSLRIGEIEPPQTRYSINRSDSVKHEASTNRASLNSSKNSGSSSMLLDLLMKHDLFEGEDPHRLSTFLRGEHSVRTSDPLVNAKIDEIKRKSQNFPSSTSFNEADIREGLKSNNSSSNFRISRINPEMVETLIQEDFDTAHRSMESNSESGGYTGNGAPSSSGGSNEVGGDDYESARWEHYVNEYSRGKNEGSPRFRGRGRGRGVSGRGAWRGSRGGHYYGRGRSSYEYEGYPAGPVSGQFYYGREFAAGGAAGSGDVAANGGGPGEGYKYHGHKENGYPKTHPGAAKDESTSVFAGSAAGAVTAAAATGAAASGKAETEKHKAEETRLKREHEHKKNMEFREKHWIERIKASGEMRKTLSRYFNELDAVNSKLLDVGTRRAELEIEVNRYNRVLKAEEDRVRLAEEKLEAMNLSF
ncbi:hypothetical protein PMKS-001278 [Pichia membranifaciens]|uniref:Transcription regulator LGE1 helical region domain-containing protein n=1 Tax=Pichia membranifaciens TaxID=4926 RepID=A0A1Q2YE40_9ASCO|nr:hypothetical protein PMKS-001278 [Pichia membranifaciens]